jgi:hypothetical protein
MPPSHPPPSGIARGPEPRAVRGGGLVVRFVWSGDRWAHVVTAEPLAEPRWASLEHDSAGDGEAAPASPPLVEFAEVETPAGTAAVAVGRWRDCHFSASILPEPGHAGVRFELACRTASPPESLGSTYLAHLAEGSSPDRAEAGGLRLEADSPDGSARVVVSAGEGRRLVRITPRGAPPGDGPRTLSWCYRLALARPAGHGCRTPIDRSDS